MGDVSGFFSPGRVAVVGASEDAESIGRAVMENLLATFQGTVIPVNPRYEQLFGQQCLDSVADSAADLAIIIVPAKAVLSVVEEAGDAGIKNLVVISAGFSEAGSDGARREQRLTTLADRYDLQIIGPNCVGIISTPVGLNATFAPTPPLDGSIGFLSQSGAMVTAVLDWAASRQIGFSRMVSLGNKAVVDEITIIQAWDDDPDTSVILGYLESIESGSKFIEVVREVTQSTPVVLLKAGQTEAGSRAAASHTGAIAGSQAAYQAGFDQAGVLSAESVSTLFEYGAMLAGQPVPSTNGVGIVTNAGGPGVLATDAIAAGPLTVASFTGDTQETLTDQLPQTASKFNPVDIIGDADAERFIDTIETIVADPNVGSLLIIACPTTPLSFDVLAKKLIDSSLDTPMAVCLMGGETPISAAEEFAAANIPTYFDPVDAVASLGSLIEYREITERTYERPAELSVDTDAARKILDSATSANRFQLGLESLSLLEAYGIPVPEGGLATNPAEAAAVASNIDGPVVMKVVSPDIAHKSDIGGVELAVKQAAVGDTFEDIHTRAREYQPDATIMGIYVQAMLEAPESVETIVGTTTDPQFGNLLLFGLGGIHVEIFQDTTVRVLPISTTEANSMVEDIQGAPILHGTRGREGVNLTAITDVLLRVGQLVQDFPSIIELDINPLIATPETVSAVDFRATLDAEE